MRVAVIGIGQKGWRGWVEGLYPQELTHVGAVLMTKGMELVAVCDGNKELLATFHKWNEAYHREKGSVNTMNVLYDDIGKMMTDVKPDIVTIATPPDTHLKVARHVAMFESVKAVLLEKPIGVDSGEGDKIRRYYWDRKIPLLINHTRRWSPLWNKVKSFLNHENCYHVVGFCNGEPIDAGTHMYDLFDMIAPNARHTFIDLYSQYQVGKYAPHLIFDVECFCGSGILSVLNNGMEAYWRPKWFGENAPYRDITALSSPRPAWDIVDYNHDMKRATLNAFSELVDLAEGTKKRPTCSGVQALKALKSAEKYVRMM